MQGKLQNFCRENVATWKSTNFQAKTLRIPYCEGARAVGIFCRPRVVLSVARPQQVVRNSVHLAIPFLPRSPHPDRVSYVTVLARLLRRSREVLGKRHCFYNNMATLSPDAQMRFCRFKRFRNALVSRMPGNPRLKHAGFLASATDVSTYPRHHHKTHPAALVKVMRFPGISPGGVPGIRDRGGARVSRHQGQGGFPGMRETTGGTHTARCGPDRHCAPPHRGKVGADF